MSIASPVVDVTTKIEKTVVTTFIAGTPGRPGVAGSPEVPAHSILVAHQAPAGNGLPPGWGYTLVEYPPSDTINYGKPPQLVPSPPAGFAGGGVALHE